MLATKICHRCGCATHATVMSMFNTEIICMQCKKKERQHPNYQAAHEADCRAIRSGNYNFSGIGKPADLD